MADNWELANLEQQVADLEAEREDLEGLLWQAREVIAEATNCVDDDYPGFHRRAEAILNKLPRR